MGLALTIAENKRHVGLRDAESFGDFCLAHGAFQASDLCDFLGGQKFVVSRDATDVDGVLFVEPVISPFEIVSGTIHLDALDVIDNRKLSWIGDEGERDQPMNVYGFSFAISTEIDLGIPNLIDAGSKDFAVTCLQFSFRPYSHSINAADSANVANFVTVAEVSDRNRSPFFCKNDIHVTGCPSGNGGLAIKDPSHAPTFGGSAIMALASDTYNGRLQFR